MRDWLRLSRSYTRLLLNRDLARWSQYVRGVVLDVGGEPASEVAYRWPRRQVVQWWSLNVDSNKDASIIADAHHIPRPDATFDTVICTEVLEHVPDPRQVVREMARVLRPGGVLVLAVPFVYPVHGAPADFWRFTWYGVNQLLLESGLQLEDFGVQGGPLTILADMAKWWLSKIHIVPIRWALWLVLVPALSGMVWLDVCRQQIDEWSCGCAMLAVKR